MVREGLSLLILDLVLNSASQPWLAEYDDYVLWGALDKLIIKLAFLAVGHSWMALIICSAKMIVFLFDTATASLWFWIIPQAILYKKLGQEALVLQILAL